jgi:cation/acetate symporter
VLLMGGTILLSILVMANFGFNFGAFFDSIFKITGTYCAAGTLNAAAVTIGGVEHAAKTVCLSHGAIVGDAITKHYTQPGILYHGQYGALDLISLGIALIFGTAGLPHILMRFYTVPSAKAARTSVVWAMILIGAFYIMTTFLGFGAATIVGKAHIGVTEGGKFIANTNLSAPLLAEAVGGTVMLAFITAVAFATILAVVAGLTIAASSAFAHDIWLNVVKGGSEDEREQVLVAKITAGIIGVVSIILAIAVKNLNVAFLVGLAFAVAASANVPAIVLTLFWRRFNTTGMITGMVIGLLSSLILIILSPSIMGIDAPTVAASARHLIQAEPLFPLANPGIVSVPLGFIAAVVGSLVTQDKSAEETFSEVNVRANIGLGAES